MDKILRTIICGLLIFVGVFALCIGVFIIFIVLEFHSDQSLLLPAALMIFLSGITLMFLGIRNLRKKI